MGLLAGLLASAPIGPINLLIAESVLEDRVFHLEYFVIGIILTDLVFAAIAFFGLDNLIRDTPLEDFLYATAGFFVLIMGIMGLIRRSSKFKRFKTSHPKPMRQFVKGVVLCGGNVAFLFYWIFVSGQIRRMASIELTTVPIMVILAGIACGTALWFYIYVRLLQKGMERINFKLINRLRTGISYTLIVLGSIAIIVTVKELWVSSIEKNDSQETQEVSSCMPDQLPPRALPQPLGKVPQG